MVIVLALTVARLATWALFRVFLPTLLFALSLFFGRPLRRAAWRCREVGLEGERGLSHALDALRARLLGRDIEVEAAEIADFAPKAPPRARVSDPPQRVAVDSEAPLDEYSESIAERERREPR